MLIHKKHSFLSILSANMLRYRFRKILDISLKSFLFLLLKTER